MKKISTLLVAGLLVLLFSASAQSRVILTSQNNYEVNIDGRNYTNSNVTISDLSQGTHSLQVYQVVSNGILGIGKKRNLITSQQFTLRNYDLKINIDQNGRARINENGRNGNTGTRYPNNNNYPNTNNYPNNRNDYPDRTDRDDHDNDHDNDKWEKNEKKYGKSEGKGRGNKYGHYKNKKNRQNSQSKNNNGNNRRGNN